MVGQLNHVDTTRCWSGYVPLAEALIMGGYIPLIAMAPSESNICSLMLCMKMASVSCHSIKKLLKYRWNIIYLVHWYKLWLIKDCQTYIECCTKWKQASQDWNTESGIESISVKWTIVTDCLWHCNGSMRTKEVSVLGYIGCNYHT